MPGVRRIMSRSRALTAAEIQRLDRRAIEDVGIPSLVLMENAGRAVAGETVRLLRQQGHRVCIVCGTGNNGGDGFVAARHLVNAGMRVRVFVLGRCRDLKEDARVNCRILRRCGLAITEINRVTPRFRAAVLASDGVVDAILGVGLNRGIESPLRDILEYLNHSKKKIIAVDIPTGLDATTGHVHGVCLKAARTVTMTCLKTGLLRNDGPRYAGRVVVADIGIPAGIGRTSG